MAQTQKDRLDGRPVCLSVCLSLQSCPQTTCRLCFPPSVVWRPCPPRPTCCPSWPSPPPPPHPTQHSLPSRPTEGRRWWLDNIPLAGPTRPQRSFSNSSSKSSRRRFLHLHLQRHRPHLWRGGQRRRGTRRLWRYGARARWSRTALLPGWEWAWAWGSRRRTTTTSTRPWE